MLSVVRRDFAEGRLTLDVALEWEAMDMVESVRVRRGRWVSDRFPRGKGRCRAVSFISCPSAKGYLPRLASSSCFDLMYALQAPLQELFFRLRLLSLSGHGHGHERGCGRGRGHADVRHGGICGVHAGKVFCGGEGLCALPRER